jgi:hypothetical protein
MIRLNLKKSFNGKCSSISKCTYHDNFGISSHVTIVIGVSQFSTSPTYIIPAPLTAIIALDDQHWPFYSQNCKLRSSPHRLMGDVEYIIIQYHG